MTTVAPQSISIRELAEAAYAEAVQTEERRRAEEEREREAEREAGRQVVIRRIEELAGCPIGAFSRTTVKGLGAIVLADAPHLKLYLWCRSVYASVHPRYEDRHVSSLADLGAVIEMSEQVYRD